MNLSSIILYAVCLTFLIGTAWTGIWYLIKEKCYESGSIVRGYQLLKVTMAGYLFPLCFITTLLYHVLIDGTEGILFVASKWMRYGTWALLGMWVFGCLLCAVSYTVMYAGFLKKVKKNQEELDGKYKEELNRIRQKLKIRKKVIGVSHMAVESPFIFGWLHPVVVVPKSITDEKQWEVILTHELTHYKQQDVFWKPAFLVLTTLFWFSPYTWKLSREYQRWAEASCDIRTCEAGINAADYYETICAMIPKEPDETHNFTSTWQSGAEEFKWRLKCMNKKQSSKLGKGMLALMTAGILMANTVCAFGAERGLTALNTALYMQTATMIDETEEIGSGEELVEHRGDESMFDGMTVEEEDSSAMTNGARASKTFSWTVNNETVKKSAVLYRNAGDTIYVSAVIEPDNMWVRIGVICPSGDIYYVNAANSMSHPFELTETGYHRVFVANTCGSTVTVSGAYR